MSVSIVTMQNAIFHPEGIDGFGDYGALGKDLALGKGLFFEGHSHIHAKTALSKKFLDIGCETIQWGKAFGIGQIDPSFGSKGLMQSRRA